MKYKTKKIIICYMCLGTGIQTEDNIIEDCYTCNGRGTLIKIKSVKYKKIK